MKQVALLNVMSVSLIVIKFEIDQKSKKSEQIPYKAPKSSEISISSNIEWPPLVTNKLLTIYRGRRELSPILIISVDQYNIGKEMSALNLNEYEKDTATSKDSSPVPSGSKEGTPEFDSCQSNPLMEGLCFVAGRPLRYETHGILHIFKENSKTSLDEGVSRSEMLCMLAVPTSMNIHDLFQFIAPCYSTIHHIRIVKSSNANHYMILIKFGTQNEADLFYSTFNGQKLNNSDDSGVCKLAYVASIEMASELEDGAFSIPGHTELPTCNVCLERMDESVDGLLTVLCKHTFHGQCLAQWSDTCCPVCRYCQTPGQVSEQHCFFCGSNEALWICLICGHVGCGRYVGQHAHRHFVETNHLFALQVGSNRVWDYVRDNYVHRLLLSEGDGKVVSFEPDNAAQAAEKDVQREHELKLNSLQLEFAQLLSSQLESQREFFETKIARTKAELFREVEESRAAMALQFDELKSVQSEMASLRKEKATYDKKLQNISQKLNKTLQEFETEKELNLNLMEAKKQAIKEVEQLEAKLKAKEQECVELSSQVQDIMAHLSAADAVAQNPEMQGGDLGVQKKPSTSRRQRR